VDYSVIAKQNVLVLNCGSSSVKYKLYEMPAKQILAQGYLQQIERDQYEAAIRSIFASLKDFSIHLVAHRVVHGGETFKKSVCVDENVKAKIRELSRYAPLHNPINLIGIEIAQSILPDVMNVAVFDTAFHQTMPEKSYLYAIPRVLYNKYKVRRYGAHGTSHAYVSQAAAEFLNRPLEDLKIITCHIGNGASLTAVKGGKSIDTSMGMTPLEGLMMGTRSGDLDPAIVPFVMNKEELTVNEVNSMLNKHSGLLAISGISSDMREITEGMEKGDPSSTLAFEMYEYRVRKYIGSYAAAMNGVDVIVFTAGVGENSIVLRQRVLEQLTYLGVELDEELNSIRSGEPRRISAANSKVEVLVVPTNEELVIARDTHRIVQASNR